MGLVMETKVNSRGPVFAAGLPKSFILVCGVVNVGVKFRNIEDELILHEEGTLHALPVCVEVPAISQTARKPNGERDLACSEIFQPASRDLASEERSKWGNSGLFRKSWRS